MRAATLGRTFVSARFVSRGERDPMTIRIVP